MLQQSLSQKQGAVFVVARFLFASRCLCKYYTIKMQRSLNKNMLALKDDIPKRKKQHDNQIPVFGTEKRDYAAAEDEETAEEAASEAGAAEDAAAEDAASAAGS